MLARFRFDVNFLPVPAFQADPRGIEDFEVHGDVGGKSVKPGDIGLVDFAAFFADRR